MTLDDLIPSHNETPLWNHTLGHLEMIIDANDEDDENYAGRAVTVIGSWTYGFGPLGRPHVASIAK